MEKYDLIIVGLGPAGASLLYSASKYGLKVLGIDRRREIGVPIQCGEYIPSYDEFKILLPKTPDKYLEVFRNIPQRIILNRTNKVKLYTPYGTEYKADFNGMVIDREAFDKWLVSMGIRNGGEVIINSRVYKLGMDGEVYIRYKGMEKVFRGDVVGLASGAASPLLDQVGLYRENNEYNLGHVIQYLMAGIDVDRDSVEMYAGNRYSPGAYAWIIPRGDDTANVGLGIRYPYTSEKISLQEYLDRFIYKHPIASKILSKGSPLSIISGIVPVAPPSKKTVSGRFISLGDAANHVIASLGAGIVTSVIVGLIAGEAVFKHILDGYPLKHYEDMWHKYIGNVLEDGYKIRLAIDILTRSDKLIEYGMKILGNKYMWNLVYTKSPKGVNLVSVIEKIARELGA